MKKIILIFMCALLFAACVEEKVYAPKPRIYPRVYYPAKSFQDFNQKACPFEFQYPEYATYLKDDYFFDEKPLSDCWFDLKTKQLNGVLHCSYIEVDNRAHFDELVNDMFEMAGEHNIKANFRDEMVVRKPNKVSGIIYEIDGDVATNLQFFLTDTTNHFFRASLYFNNKVAADSMAPIYDFMREDISKMIETFAWK